MTRVAVLSTVSYALAMLNRMTSMQTDFSAGDKSAERARRAAVRAGRWYAGYLAIMGLASAALVVLMEAVVPDGFARSLVSVGWALVIMAAAWWAEQRSAFPANASRVTWIAFGIWLVAYILIVGPIIRGTFDNQLIPWLLAAIGMSIPFFVAAAMILRRR